MTCPYEGASLTRVSATRRFFLGGSAAELASGSLFSASVSAEDPDAVVLEADSATSGATDFPDSGGTPALVLALDTGLSKGGNGALLFDGVGKGVPCVDMDPDADV